MRSVRPKTVGSARSQRLPGTTEALSLRERFVFGAAAGWIGALLGLPIALLIWVVLLWIALRGWFSLTSPTFKWSVVAFVGTYFFALGFVRGARSGDLLGDVLTLVGVAAAAPVMFERGAMSDGELSRSRSEQTDQRGAAFLWQRGHLALLLAGVLVIAVWGPW